MGDWKQERPMWCPNTECLFRMRSQDSLCVGELPVPLQHDGIDNTHRLCQRGAADDGLWLHVVELNQEFRKCPNRRFKRMSTDGDLV